MAFATYHKNTKHWFKDIPLSPRNTDHTRMATETVIQMPGGRKITLTNNTGNRMLIPFLHATITKLNDTLRMIQSIFIMTIIIIRGRVMTQRDMLPREMVGGKVVGWMVEATPMANLMVIILVIIMINLF